MQVSIFQGPENFDSIGKNLDIMSQQAQAAAAEGSDLLIFPEMYLSGYNIGAQQTREVAQHHHGPAALRAAEIASNHNIGLLYGFPELDTDQVYNSALLIDKNGEQLSLYRKSHLFGDIDRCAFSQGNSASQIVEFDGLKVGILICYDIEFAENARLLALAGADFIAVPTALMVPYEFVPMKLVPARAFENQVFLAYANRCGHEQELEYYGLSCICGPDGTDLARAGKNEQLITAILNPAEQKNSRAINTHLADRRPELYSKLVE